MKIIFALCCLAFGSVSFGAAAAGAEENPFLDEEWEGQRLKSFGSQGGGNALYGPQVYLGSLDKSSKETQEELVKLYREQRLNSQVLGNHFLEKMRQRERADLLSLRPVYKEKEELLGFVGGHIYEDGSLYVRSFWLPEKDRTEEDAKLISQAFLTFLGGDILRVPRETYNCICWSIKVGNEFYKNIFIKNFGLTPWQIRSEEDLGKWYDHDDRMYFRVSDLWAHIPKIWGKLGQESIVGDDFNPDEFERARGPIKETAFLKSMALQKDDFFFHSGAEESAMIPFQLMYGVAVEDRRGDLFPDDLSL